MQNVALFRNYLLILAVSKFCWLGGIIWRGGGGGGRFVRHLVTSRNILRIRRNLHALDILVGMMQNVALFRNYTADTFIMPTSYQ